VSQSNATTAQRALIEILISRIPDLRAEADNSGLSIGDSDG
jgi:hypothetical protein